MGMKSETDQLPKGWIATTLGNVVSRLANGISRKQVKTKTKYPVTRIQTISEGYIDTSRLGYLTKMSPDELKKFRLLPGDILFSNINSTPHLGKTAIVSSEMEKLYHGMNLLLLRPNPNLVIPKFLHYLCMKYRKSGTFASIAKHAVNQASINQKNLSAIIIPLPPIPIQKVIVDSLNYSNTRIKFTKEELSRIPDLTRRLRMAILSKCFMGELTERNPEDEHARSLLETMKSEQTELVQRHSKKYRAVNLDEMPELPEKWIWTTIGEIGNFIGSGITPRGGRKVYVEKGVPFIRSQNVYPDGLRTENIVFVTSEMHESMSRTKVQTNDILLNITGASIGRSTFVPDNLGPANVNQHVCIIRTSKLIHPAYLSWFLNSYHGQNQIMTSQSGVTREGLNYSQVRSIRFPLAPLGEQNQIVKIVGNMFENSFLLGKTVENSLDKLQILEQSILKVAFSGKLVHTSGNEPESPHHGQTQLDDFD